MLWVVASPQRPHHDSTSPPTPSFGAGARRSCDHDTPVMRRSPGAPPPATRSGVLSRWHAGTLGSSDASRLRSTTRRPERALGAHLLAGRQRLQQIAIAPREAFDAGVGRGDHVPLVLALLRLVHLQGHVANFVGQLVQGRGRVGRFHGRTISHARRPRASAAASARRRATQHRHFHEPPSPGSVVADAPSSLRAPGERRRAGRRRFAFVSQASARPRPMTSRPPRRSPGRPPRRPSAPAPPPPPAAQPRRRPPPRRPRRRRPPPTRAAASLRRAPPVRASSPQPRR